MCIAKIEAIKQGLSFSKAQPWCQVLNIYVALMKYPKYDVFIATRISVEQKVPSQSSFDTGRVEPFDLNTIWFWLDHIPFCAWKECFLTYRKLQIVRAVLDRVFDLSVCSNKLYYVQKECTLLFQL